MEAFLRGLLPKCLTGPTFSIYPSQCKQELLENLPQRLTGYASWLPETYRIVVLVDRDDDDCIDLKRQLEQSAAAAGLTTRSQALSERWQIANRIVIEELEAWYFGDWQAVREAYPRVSDGTPRQARYRDPDDVRGGTWEAFERILEKKGYFSGGLRKIEAARRISPFMDPDRNRSRSFAVFFETLVEMTAA